MGTDRIAPARIVEAAITTDQNIVDERKEYHRCTKDTKNGSVAILREDFDASGGFAPPLEHPPIRMKKHYL